MFTRAQQQLAGLPRWFRYLLIAAISLTGFLVTVFAVLVFTVSTNIPIRSTGSDQALRLPSDLPAPLLEIIDILDENEVAIIPTGEPLPQLASNDRITVLVMGVDRRPGESLSTRTDTMILLSINPEDDTASMLSIPRDLYVDIPGVGRQRINTALPFGAYNGGEAVGAELVRQTINYNLGVTVDHYMLLDFQTVVGVIDSVGGVMIDVPYDINDPTYPDNNYGFDPLYIPQGSWLMSGDVALKYMRTRHADGDFNRSKRQQQVILAFKDAILKDGIGQAATNARAFYSEAREGVVTDMSLTDMLSLANAANGISAENIRSTVLDANYVTDYTTDSGAYVLLPRTAEISVLIKELFN